MLLFVAVIRLIPSGVGAGLPHPGAGQLLQLREPRRRSCFPLAAVLLATAGPAGAPKHAKLITLVAAGRVRGRRLLRGRLRLPDRAGADRRAQRPGRRSRSCWSAPPGWRSSRLAAYAIFQIWRNLYYTPKPKAQPGMYGQPQQQWPGAYGQPGYPARLGQPGYGQPGRSPAGQPAQPASRLQPGPAAARLPASRPQPGPAGQPGQRALWGQPAQSPPPGQPYAAPAWRADAAQPRSPARFGPTASPSRPSLPPASRPRRRRPARVRPTPPGPYGVPAYGPARPTRRRLDRAPPAQPGGFADPTQAIPQATRTTTTAPGSCGVRPARTVPAAARPTRIRRRGADRGPLVRQSCSMTLWPPAAAAQSARSGLGCTGGRHVDRGQHPPRAAARRRRQGARRRRGDRAARRRGRRCSTSCSRSPAACATRVCARPAGRAWSRTRRRSSSR